MARIDGPGDLMAIRTQAVQLAMNAAGALNIAPTSHEEFRSIVNDYVEWLVKPIDTGTNLTVATAVAPFPGGAA